MGIPLGRVFTLTVALGVGLAGLGGALMAPLFNVYPAVGFPLTIKAFAIIILGGMGNLAGALLASFVVSLVESLLGDGDPVGVAEHDRLRGDDPGPAAPAPGPARPGGRPVSRGRRADSGSAAPAARARKTRAVGR